MSKNMRTRIIGYSLIVVFLIAGLFGIFWSQFSYAISKEMRSSIDAKFYAVGLEECYKQSKMNTQVDISKTNLKTTLISSDTSFKIRLKGDTSNPASFTSCKDLVRTIGNARFSYGISDDYGISRENMIDFLNKLGYEHERDEAYSTCFRFAFTRENNGSSWKGQTFCSPGDVLGADRDSFVEVTKADGGGYMDIRSYLGESLRSEPMLLQVCGYNTIKERRDCAIVELDQDIRVRQSSEEFLGGISRITVKSGSGIFGMVGQEKRDIHVLFTDHFPSAASIWNKKTSNTYEHPYYLNIKTINGESLKANSGSQQWIREDQWGYDTFCIYYDDGESDLDFCPQEDSDITYIDKYITVGQTVTMRHLYETIERVLKEASNDGRTYNLDGNGWYLAGDNGALLTGVFSANDLAVEQNPYYTLPKGECIHSTGGGPGGAQCMEYSIALPMKIIMKNLFGFDDYNQLSISQLYTLFAEYVASSCNINTADYIEENKIDTANMKEVVLANDAREQQRYYVWTKDGSEFSNVLFNGPSYSNSGISTILKSYSQITLENVINTLNKFCKIDGSSGALSPSILSSGGTCYTYDTFKDVPTISELGGLYDGEDYYVVEDEDVDDDDDYEPDECYTNSGSLGWVICPVITALTGVGRHMWGQIETHMKIPAEGIFASVSGVKPAFDAMLTVANVLFVILFLIIIFSQLTGYGIDNYGIKKMLPKLILVAILANLSYFICEIAVDLSNILGVGLNGLLSGAAGPIATTGGTGTGGAVTSWALSAVLVVGLPLLYGVLNGGGTVSGAAAAIGLAVLGIIIIVVLAMLFLYVTLVAREAGIVVSIILAPVAIVGYVLPNTEKISKKWFDLFKALLIVYPICGALVGGGQLAGAVLASAGMGIAAMIVQVLPFFLIPTLLRSSLSLAGNVGARLSSLGRSLGRRGSSLARNTISGTERFKDFQKRQQEQGAAGRAERLRRRLQARVDNGGQLSERNQDRLRKAQDTVLARNKQLKENELRAGSGYFEAMTAKQNLESNTEQRAIARYGSQAYIDAMTAKQDLESTAEQNAINKYNDANYIKARTQAIADEAKRQQSKDRAALLMHGRGGKIDLANAVSEWENAFNSGNTDNLDMWTNVITQRFQAQGANSIAKSLAAMKATDPNFGKSMEQLQWTMNNNSDFAGHMRSKASDAYKMISDRGLDSSGNNTDLSYFSHKDRRMETQIKDWASASKNTLQRAIDSQALDDDMIKSILSSDDPTIKSGILSDKDKTNTLKAALYNRAHVGNEKSVEDAAKEYDNEQVIRKNEEEPRKAGKTKIEVFSGGLGSGGGMAGMVSFEGYPVPSGFNAKGSPTYDMKTGHWIYENKDDGSKWDATEGRYIPKKINVPPTNQNS